MSDLSGAELSLIGKGRGGDKTLLLHQDLYIGYKLQKKNLLKYELKNCKKNKRGANILILGRGS